MTAFWSQWRRRSEAQTVQPGGIDCSAVVERLYEYLDAELGDPELVEKIRQHLEVCQRCYPQFRFEEAFLKFVAEVARTSAPPELRRKIFQRILEEEAEN